MASNAIDVARAAVHSSPLATNSRTPFVLGAIALTFALYIILRGDLERYKDILLGTPEPAEQ